MYNNGVVIERYYKSHLQNHKVSTLLTSGRKTNIDTLKWWQNNESNTKSQ